MSKKADNSAFANITRAVSLIVISVIAILIIAIMSGFAYYKVSNQRTADRITSEYQLVHLPPSLKLGQKNFSASSPSLGQEFVGWTYSYSVAAHLTISELHDQLGSSLQAAGYTPTKVITASPDAEDSVLSARNGALQVNFTLGGATTNTSNALAKAVEVQAYE